MNEWLYSQWVSLKICLFNSFAPLAEIFFFVEGFNVYIFGGNQFKWYPEPETTSDVFGVTCPLPEISGCWRKCTCQLSILKQCLWQLGQICPLPFCLFILLFHFGKQVPETYNEQTGNAFLFCSLLFNSAHNHTGCCRGRITRMKWTLLSSASKCFQMVTKTLWNQHRNRQDYILLWF